MGTTRFRTGSGFDWVLEPEQALGELAHEYGRAIHAGVLNIVRLRAPEIENWMKDNAPWTDRTGNARQSLHTEVNDVTNVMVELILAHGVDYGLFLEVRNAGRFAVVNPALDHWGPIIWNDVVRMMS